MTVNVNPVTLRFRVVGAGGDPVPELVVTQPTPADFDAQPGGTVAVSLAVRNESTATDLVVQDAVPGLKAGSPVLSAATVGTPVTVAKGGGTATVPVVFTLRADAVAGQQGEYQIDLVVIEAPAEPPVA